MRPRNFALALVQRQPVTYRPVPRDRPLRRHLFDNQQLIARFNKWLYGCGFARKTRASYLASAKAFSRFLDGRSFVMATKDDVLNHISEQLDRKYAATTISTYHFALRTLFRFLHLGGQVSVSVPHQLKNRKLPRALPNVKTEAEIDRVIAAADSPRNLAILELLYATGLRIDELAKLRVEHVDLRKRTLIVFFGKGDKERIALFGRKARQALKIYLHGRECGPLFGISSRQIERLIVATAKRAGVAAVSSMTFRHSFATHLLNRGMGLRAIQQLMGHESLKSTAVYLNVATEDLQRTHTRFHPRG